MNELYSLILNLLLQILYRGSWRRGQDEDHF